MPLRVVLRPILPYVIGILGISLIVYYIDDRAFKSGVSKTTIRYEERMQQEAERIREANEASLEAARTVEKQLRKQLEARNEQIQQIIEEGSIDPDADRLSIGPDSVSRINRIR